MKHRLLFPSLALAAVAFAAPRGPLKIEGGEIYEAYAPWRLPDPAREDLEGYPVRLSAAFYVAEGAPAASWKALIFPAGIAAEKKQSRSWQNWSRCCNSSINLLISATC